MVGSDSNSDHIARFPPFAGLEKPQKNVRFFYCLGRENKTISDGWGSLHPVNNIVGPELSFAREVMGHQTAPIAIIKVAAGGTHLGGDWNPDEPSGFKLYPLALAQVRNALDSLRQPGVKYRIEGFMWHQGENDMFDANYMASYGKNLQNFVNRWRQDLEVPNLRFYIGELCTKTIWGMDLRPRMYAISLGQKEVARNDENVEYVPTSHVAVEIGGGVGLHYHYGTLGQLEHGVNYARAYLRTIDCLPSANRQLRDWPYPASSKIKLFVLLGHRNMEGERAFKQQLSDWDQQADLLEDQTDVAFKYSVGGGFKVSDGWEPLGPSGAYDTFGPELSFAKTLRNADRDGIAIAKFTHSGAQIIDFTPEGSEAKDRNLYPKLIEFIRDSYADLENKGHEVEIGGIIYHVGENDMSWGPFRKDAAKRVRTIIEKSRKDLNLPSLDWYISQQRPTDHESVNMIDVTSGMKQMAAEDPNIICLQLSEPPAQDEQLVFDTRGVVWLGEKMAESYLQRSRLLAEGQSR